MDFDKLSFAFGFSGGIQPKGETSLVPSPGSKAPTYSYDYGVELVIPIDVVFLRPNISRQQFTAYEGKARDSIGNYTQAMEGRVDSFGGKVSVNTFFSKDGRKRIFFGGGYGRSKLRTESSRQYTSGTINRFTQDGEASSQYWEVHFGFSSFLVQNWAINLEGGFRRYSFNEVSSRSKRNLSGGVITGANTILTSTGSKASYTVADPYLNLGLMLCF
jgi:hypothetical protein